MFDIVVQTPVHILSCLCNNANTLLPRYTETLDATTIPTHEICPCPIKRPNHHQGHNSHAPHASSSHPHDPTVLERTQSADSAESADGGLGLGLARVGTGTETLYDRNVVFERLITGQQSRSGEAPPAYEGGGVGRDGGGW